MQNSLPMSEDEYLKLMLKTVDQMDNLKPVLLARQVLVSGQLKRETVCELQNLLIYHATRVGIARQARFRQERRAFFADSNWKRYRMVIEAAEKEKHARMVKFTSKLLQHLAVKNEVYVKSMQMCPAQTLQKTQEHAILNAYSEFYDMVAKANGGNIPGIEPVTENIAKMALVDYQVKMAAL